MSVIHNITSMENKIIKQVKHLAKKSRREESGLFIAEGARIVRDALSDGLTEYVIATSPCQDYHGSQYIISRDMFEKLSDTRTPQGIMAVCRMPRWDEAVLSRASLVLVCENIADPGNLGTMMRTAEAAGADAAVLIGNTVDLYNPKTVRSTMGSVFRVPVFRGERYIDILKKEGFTLAVTCLDGAQSLYETDSGCSKIALTVGSEAHGVSRELLEKADLRIKIPMCGRVESLNAAIAASVCLYEYRRRLNLNN